MEILEETLRGKKLISQRLFSFICESNHCINFVLRKPRYLRFLELESRERKQHNLETTYVKDLLPTFKEDFKAFE